MQLGRHYRCGGNKNAPAIPLLPEQKSPGELAAAAAGLPADPAQGNPKSQKGDGKKGGGSKQEASKMHAKQSWAAYLASMTAEQAHLTALEMEASKRALDYEVGTTVNSPPPPPPGACHSPGSI